MNSPRKLPVLLAAAGLLTAARVSAQTTYTWSATGSGAFTNAGNWTPQAVPGGSDTATIDNVSGGPHSQTVTYDVSTGNLTTPLTLGTLNLLNTAGAGFTNLLQLTSTATSDASTTTNPASPQGVFSIANALTLSSATTGTVELRLSPTSTTAANFVTLQVAGGITVGNNGILTLDASAFNTAKPTVRANTVINGGTLNILGSSSVGGFGSGTGQRNTLTLNSGNITFGNASGRLLVFDNFTTTGGTITANSANTIEVYGTANSIAGVSYVNASALTYSFRNNAAQSLTSAVDLPNLLIRNGFVDTVSVTSPGQNVGLITINAAAGSTLQLGSNMNTATLPSFGLAGVVLDLNGNTLNVTATGTLTPTTSTIFKSTVAGGALQVASFNLGALATPSQVQAGTTIVTTASPTGVANIVSTAGNATFDPTSTLVFTGNSTSVANNRLGLATPTGAANNSTIGNLIVGTGTSTTYVQLMTGTFAMQGSASVLTGSTLDLNSRAHTVAGKLQGGGTVSGASPASLTFTGTGGLSPGFSATGNTGSGSVGMLTLAGTETLAFATSSVSIFDLASSTSFDNLVAGGNILTLNGSTLNVNLLSGYNPAVGTTWNIITGANAASTGTFNTVTNTQGDSFSFTFSGGVGTLTLTAVPEPSTWMIMGVGLLFLAAPMRRAYQRAGKR